MESNLLETVIGQSEAVRKVSRAIQRSRVGLKDPNRPIGTFLFVGPTGVGKTYLTKQLALEMFGSEASLIRIDMSEYGEKHTVSRMMGAPPGYVGYEEGGQLTERVRRRPYSIVLLDEIEKAHTDVFNLLLQVMDEGRLTDSYGRTIDFRNTILIMTSNIGTRELKEFGKGIGFAETSSDNKLHSREVIKKALNKRFAPEFINRVDEIINFDQLDLSAIVKIVDLELRQVLKRTKEMGYTLLMSEEGKNFLANKGYDVQFGARPLKRAVQNYIEDELSELIISKKINAGDTIKVEVDTANDKLLFVVQEDKQE
jgi:ATP-dependent Clp protease ATP-binding subunit ClpC